MAYSHGGVGAGTGYLPSRSTLVPQPLQFSVERCFGFPQTQTLVGSICAELDLSRDTGTPDHPGCGAMIEAQQEISGFTTPVFLLAVSRCCGAHCSPCSFWLPGMRAGVGCGG